VIENYFGGYLKHPYISFYTGAAANRVQPSACGRRPSPGIVNRVRSVAHVIEELEWARRAFPQVKEFFFETTR